ncbi:methyltransferase [Chelativorans sp.]|uniref:class I SAM-dependent methyltransferase n=1 Tax=Chelativorans sp. TaxID=2203393 RepID=UPI0028127764|nr:methyltransferase [Chelativorans sp.]
MIDGFPAWAPYSAHSGEGFNPESFAKLAELEAGNFWFRARNELIIWALRRYFMPARSLLEIGCGTGYVLTGVAAAFPQVRLVGSEIFIAGLAQAKSRVPDASLIQMDARHIPYRGEFDVAIAADVLEHIEEDEQVLSQLFKALRPGGGAIITVPQHPWMWSGADDYACHVRRYTSSEIRRKIVAAGFAVELSTSFVSLLLPLMAASRILNHRASQPNPHAEFNIPRPVNSLLEQVLRSERAAISIGLRFPFGGSRFVVARKAT